MSVEDFLVATRIVEAHPDLASFVGPRQSALLARAEEALGGRLPPSYRAFVSRFGAGSFGAFEVYGIIDNQFEHSVVPHGVWLTLRERRDWQFPAGVAIIGDTGDGDRYCVELTEAIESPVMIYQVGVSFDPLRSERVSTDFGSFFLEQVQRQLT